MCKNHNDVDVVSSRLNSLLPTQLSVVKKAVAKEDDVVANGWSVPLSRCEHLFSGGSGCMIEVWMHRFISE